MIQKENWERDFRKKMAYFIGKEGKFAMNNFVEIAKEVASQAKLERVEENPEPVKSKKIKLAGAGKSKGKINPPEIRRADTGARRYTPEEKAEIIRLWNAGEKTADIAAAFSRTTYAMRQYLYSLVVKGEIIKRNKPQKKSGWKKRSIEDRESDMGIDDEAEEKGTEDDEFREE